MSDTRTAGRYELQEELGRGAMGIVYKAYDPRIGRAVAVKTMRLTEAGTGMSYDELINRFDIETKAAGRLTHPNIVVVYDAGEDGGVFYITMELVTGRSLQALVDLKQVFPLPRVMRLMEQAGAALDFAHQNSVVHRDIKPANLLITADDTVKISDFGTAKILQKGATQTGAILGTPSYMSPEQVKGKPVDGRSDIFSLGVILYELVTGEKPFPGQNVTTVIYKIVNEEPIPPRDIDNSVHPGLSQVIMRALNKDPDARYQTCKDLVEDLKNYKALGGEGDSATVVIPGRARPREVEEAIARTRSPQPAASGRIPPPEKPPLEVQPSRAPSPRPLTLPPLTSTLPRTLLEEEKPKSRAGAHVFLTLVLVALIVGAGYFMWPDVQRMLNLPGAESPQPAATSAPPAAATTAQPPASEPAATPPAEEVTAEDTGKEAGKETASAEPPAPPKELTPDERNAQEIQNRLAEAGLGDRVRAEVEGRNVTLTGSVTPEEARRLRARLRRLPGGLRLVDRLRVARATPAPVAAGGEAPATGSGDKPKPAPGRGELEVLTDQLGGTAVLRGPNGYVQSRKTPGRFDDLPPGSYTLQVGKEGYQTVQKQVTVRAGNISQEEVKLQAVGGGLIVDSQPPGAEVYINGRLRGVTPATLSLDAGRYTVTLRRTGYQEFSRPVQVGSELTKMDVPLARLAPGQTAAPAPAPAPPPAARPAAGKGWIEVRSIPPGADILINNSSTGRRTPARLELEAGNYTLTLFARGYTPLTKQVRVEADKTFTLNEALPRQ